jgi:hypothetical protein
VIVPPTLAFGVVVCRLLPAGCRAFAACSPPVDSKVFGLVRNATETEAGHTGTCTYVARRVAVPVRCRQRGPWR